MLKHNAVSKIPSIFIGGGTPSLLGRTRLAKLLRGLNTLMERNTIQKAPEFTIEVNPESLSQSVLDACIDGGVNRISIGIQTLNEASRQAVGRSGSASDAVSALSLLSASFPGKVSADLISGLPFQNESLLKKDIDTLLDYGIDHVSLYALSVEEGTALYERSKQGNAKLPTEERAEILWLSARDYLEQRGLRQYEVSNFSVIGAECRHNLGYWQMHNWIGVGPGASGTIIHDPDTKNSESTAVRYTYPHDISNFLNGSLQINREELDRKTLMVETLIMGFRCIFGPDPVLFARRFDCSLQDCIGRSLKKAESRGLLQEARIALNGDGLSFLNPFLVDCMNELEEHGIN